MTLYRNMLRSAVGGSAATALFLAVFAVLQASPAAADVPPWQRAPNARSQHFVDRPNPHAERRSSGIVSYAPPVDEQPSHTGPTRPDRSAVAARSKPKLKWTAVQQTNYEVQGEPQVIYEGDGPVIFDDGPVIYGDEGPVVYENGPMVNGPPMMGNPGGIPSQRRVGEDYWNSPDSDRGYPCYPVWLPLRNHLYFRGEYLSWWSQGSTLTPWAGVADGGIQMNDGSRSGMRLTMGYWFDLYHQKGIEVNYLTLNTLTDQYINGNATIDATTSLDGIEVLFRRAMITNGCVRFDLLLGYRGLELKDDLLVNVQGREVANIHTRNQFDGIELGFARRSRWCYWTLDMEMKLALGGTKTALRIEQTATTYNFNEFAVVPELGVTLGYELTPRLRATLGYTFVYWSMLARPGDQLDQVPAADVLIRTTDYWTQGLSAGLEWRF